MRRIGAARIQRPAARPSSERPYTGLRGAIPILGAALSFFIVGCGGTQKSIPRAHTTATPTVTPAGDVTAPIDASTKVENVQKPESHQTRGGEGQTGPRKVSAERIGQNTEANEFYGLSKHQLILASVVYGVTVILGFGLVVMLVFFLYRSSRVSII